MRKKSDKELGYIITDGMIDTIGNKDLTDAQVGLFMRSIVGGNRDYAKNDIIVKALVTAFIEQFKAVNKRRTEMIGRRREGNRERERLRREESSLARQKLDKIDDLCEHMSAHVGTCDNMSAHVRTCGVIKGSKDIYISPYNPPAGDKKSSSAKAVAEARETAPENEPSERPTRSPTTGGPSTGGSRTGTTKRLKGKPGTTAAPATQEDQPTASRGAVPSKKIGGGRCRWMDAEGFCTSEKMQGGGFKCTGCENREPIGADGAAPAKKTGAPDPLKDALKDALTAEYLVEVAKTMVEQHPNAKSSQHAVNRAMANAATQEPGGGKATVDAIAAAHAAWCATDGWAADKGQFVQALAAWIRNGGWRKLPPQKAERSSAFRTGREEGMSFGASL